MGSYTYYVMGWDFMNFYVTDLWLIRGQGLTTLLNDNEFDRIKSLRGNSDWFDSQNGPSEKNESGCE